MDQNSWIWRKKSTEKTLVSDKQKSRNDDEVTEVWFINLLIRCLY